MHYHHADWYRRFVRCFVLGPETRVVPTRSASWFHRLGRWSNALASALPSRRPKAAELNFRFRIANSSKPEARTSLFAIRNHMVEPPKKIRIVAAFAAL